MNIRSSNVVGEGANMICQPISGSKLLQDRFTSCNLANTVHSLDCNINFLVIINKIDQKRVILLDALVSNTKGVVKVLPF